MEEVNSKTLLLGMFSDQYHNLFRKVESRFKPQGKAGLDWPTKLFKFLYMNFLL